MTSLSIDFTVYGNILNAIQIINKKKAELEENREESELFSLSLEITITYITQKNNFISLKYKYFNPRFLSMTFETKRKGDKIKIAKLISILVF